MIDFPANDYGDRAVQLYPPPINEFQRLQREVHQTAVDKGWWDEGRGHGEIIALIHSELSEALEAIRNGNPQSEKIPEFTELELELADVAIRLMDYAERCEIDLWAAIVAKAEYNKSRPYKHGGKKF